MTISAKIITHSASLGGRELMTMQLRYPKFIHGEFMTHRVFSRNASSSRAIPVERMIQDVLDDPATPVFWGRNQRGMQAAGELDEERAGIARVSWLSARDAAVEHAREMSRTGVHKQLVNRIIEPWCHINVVVTATEWDNFYGLRRHPDAQPEMRALADAMWEAHHDSKPRQLLPGKWHLPYVDIDAELDKLPSPPDGHPRDSDAMQRWVTRCFIKISVARCARVSYLTHDGRAPNVEEDLALYERLATAVPPHLSPTEHQATPDEAYDGYGYTGNPNGLTAEEVGLERVKFYRRAYLHGNFVGFCQYRKLLETEVEP